MGPDGQGIITKCKMWKNHSCAIKVGVANLSRIINNHIKENEGNGILIQSADPFIFNNRIEKNRLNGVYSYTYKGIRSDGKIKRNEVTGNNHNGFLIKGRMNKAIIEANQFIGYNKKAGIKLEDEANVTIFNNTIVRNLAQGILCVERSFAHIELNRIYENVKANIAFGGKFSINTNILRNKIKGSKQEGIFIVECGQCWIHNNDIYKNNHGIVAQMSGPELWNNRIYQNKGCGILLQKDSRPIMQKNRVYENEGIGFYLRDISTPKECSRNIFENNLVEVSCQKTNLDIEQFLINNDARGDIRIPQVSRCTLI